MAQAQVLEFLMLVGQLKNVKRTGWVNHGVKLPESVADHMYRMAMMTFLLKGDSTTIDTTRCLKLAVVHDLAECIVGDITPNDPMGKEEKHRREKEAMDHLASLVDAQIGKEILDLYEEYENQSSLESKSVKDLDRFEMILQAFEYEQAESRKGELQDFFDSTRGKWQNPMIKGWVEELERRREAQGNK